MVLGFSTITMQTVTRAYPITGCTDGQLIKWEADAAGIQVGYCADDGGGAGGSDNFGSHVATTQVNLSNNSIIGQSTTTLKSKKQIYIPAASLYPLDIGDSVPPLQKSASNYMDILAAAYDDTTKQCRGGTFQVPYDVDTDSSVLFNALFYPSANPATATSVVWTIETSTVNTTGRWDFATSTVTYGGKSVSTVNGAVSLSTVTATVASLSWAANNEVQFFHCRKPADAGDTLVGNALLKSIWFDIPRR
jgi:hypothetical protein